VLVKFKDNVNVNIVSETNTKGKTSIKTSVSSVDEVLKKESVLKINKVFKQQGYTPTRYIQTYKGETIEVPQLFNIYRIKYDSKADAKELAELLAEDPTVDFAEPNYFVYTMNTTPNDPLYSSQWHLGAVNTPAAWDSVTGDTTQIIGIIDTGVDWDHPDLDDNIWTNWDEIPNNEQDDDANGYVDDVRGWDFINDDNDPNDDNSHGTHVAGIAAAEGDNGIGVCGVAWNSRIMPVKMLQSSGTGNSSDLATAINYASSNGATVINMSLGSYGESLTVKTALENAYAFSVLVAAAGNDGRCICPECLGCGTMYPAAYSFVLGVESSTQLGTRSSFSNYDPSGPVVAANSYGHNYEIQAPGVGIYSTFPNGGYNSLNGTSMASPIVAGAIALMKENNPSQSTEQIFARLIQGANNGILDIFNSMNYTLVPDLYFVEYTLIDTLPGCDNDGIADAGETIELFLTAKNAGGWADSVWSKIRFGPYEDTTVAIIIDSTSYVGDISAYATLTGELDPFVIEIDSNIVNNRNVVFQYEIGAANQSSFTGELIIAVQNGFELSGYYVGTTHLTSDRHYIITDNVVFDTLLIDPGTIISLNNEKSIGVSKHLVSVGKPDSLILFTNNSGYWTQLRNVDNANMIIKYCIFEYAIGFRTSDQGIVYGAASIEDCIFRYNVDILFFNNPPQLKRCIFTSNDLGILIPGITNSFENNLVVDNAWFDYQQKPTIKAYQITYLSKIKNNFVYNNLNRYGNSINVSFGIIGSAPWSTYHLSPNYFGVMNLDTIETRIEDYFENSTKPIILGDSALATPSSKIHGFAWKIEINDILINKIDNLYNSPTGLGVVGSETLKFDVYFNRAMNTSYTPFLTFGVREPYTQNIVQDSSSWSIDSTVWTAYHTVGLETGDGIQTVRVANARDDEYFEIPIEETRFEFVIQAASATSINFIATPGIGKVDLEWPEATTDDVLGYNMYRMLKLTDSTYSDTFLINTELITDTVYTDYAVIPDSTYKYLYKIVGTDLAESDFSKAVSAIPFDAANGDANGDMSVNVLDITTIVSYMLNQNPTPFLFDAADLNGDNTINVLDIIGVVQLISGSKSVPISKLIDVNEDVAYIFLEENKITLRSEQNIAALQFELKGENLEDVNLFCEMEGFEFANAVDGDKIICVLYSFREIVVPGGLTDLIRVEKNGAVLNWGSIIAGDLNGNYVPVYKETEQSIVADDITLSAQPNPFNNSTMIYYTIPERSEIIIEIFDIQGKKIKSVIQEEQNAGSYSVVWNGNNDNGMTVSPGIYMCNLQVIVRGKIEKRYRKSIKIILTD